MKILNQKSSKSFKKNGIQVANKQENIFFTKKNELEFKKRFYIRFTLAILATNLLTYSMTRSDDQIKDKEIRLDVSSNKKVLKVPLSVNFPIKDKDILATIITEDNLVITNQGRILKKLNNENNGFESQLDTYLISIPTKDLSRFMNHKSKRLFAYPQHTEATKRSAPNEIIF